MSQHICTRHCSNFWEVTLIIYQKRGGVKALATTLHPIPLLTAPPNDQYTRTLNQTPLGVQNHSYNYMIQWLSTLTLHHTASVLDHSVVQGDRMLGLLIFTATVAGNERECKLGHTSCSPRDSRLRMVQRMTKLCHIPLTLIFDMSSSLLGCMPACSFATGPQAMLHSTSMWVLLTQFLSSCKGWNGHSLGLLINCTVCK